jgi:methionyl-tRNA formyltransferase
VGQTVTVTTIEKGIRGYWPIEWLTMHNPKIKVWETEAEADADAGPVPRIAGV